MRSVLVIDQDSTELDYSTKHEEVQRTTPPIELDPHKRYTMLDVRVLRAEFEKEYHLCIPNAYVNVSVGVQHLVTPSVRCSGKTFNYVTASDKKFYVWFGDHMSSADRVIKFSVFDANNQCLGTCEAKFDPWIANGRFEGDVQLCSKKGNVGKLSIAVKCLKDDKRPAATSSVDHINDAVFRNASQVKSTDIDAQDKLLSFLSHDNGNESVDSSPSSFLNLDLQIAAAEITKLDFVDKSRKENNFTAQITIGDHVNFSTTCVSSSGWSPVWQDDFYSTLPSAIEVKKERLKLTVLVLMKNEQGVNEEVGSCSHFISKWIESDVISYSGALDLFFDGEVVGNVFILINPKTKPLSQSLLTTHKSGSPQPLLYKNRTFSPLSGDDHATPLQSFLGKSFHASKQSNFKFSESEIEKIFHGIQEDFSLPPKNPYAYEVRREFQHQLHQYSEEYLDKDLDAIQKQLDYYIESNKEMFERVKALRLALETDSQTRVGEAPTEERIPLRMLSSVSYCSAFSLDSMDIAN